MEGKTNFSRRLQPVRNAGIVQCLEVIDVETDPDPHISRHCDAKDSTPQLALLTRTTAVRSSSSRRVRAIFLSSRLQLVAFRMTGNDSAVEGLCRHVPHSRWLNELHSAELHPRACRSVTNSDCRLGDCCISSSSSNSKNSSNGSSAITVVATTSQRRRPIIVRRIATSLPSGTRCCRPHDVNLRHEITPRGQICRAYRVPFPQIRNNCYEISAYS